MTKVDLLAAGVLLIPSSVGVVNDQKNGGVEFAAFPANGKQGHAALTNNQQQNVDQMQKNNVIKRSGVHINRKKYKNIFFPNQVQMKNLKTCRNPFLGLDLSMYVNKTPIHLLTPVHVKAKYTISFISFY